MTTPEQKWVDLINVQINNLENDIQNMQKEMDAKIALRNAYIEQLAELKPTP